MPDCVGGSGYQTIVKFNWFGNQTAVNGALLTSWCTALHLLPNLSLASFRPADSSEAEHTGQQGFSQLGLNSQTAKSHCPESIGSKHTILYPGSGFSGLEFAFQVTCRKYGICSGKGPPGHLHAIVHANTSKSHDVLVETPDTGKLDCVEPCLSTKNNCCRYIVGQEFKGDVC